MPKRCLLILLDGLGDRSYRRLGDRTPLQAAHTPHLDRLAAAGAGGLYHAGILGQALPSENAHFSMFGYDMADFPGRGLLEALGAGLDCPPEAVFLLAHFVSVQQVDRILMLAKGKPEATPDEIAALTDCIRTAEHDNGTVTFYPTGGIRGLLRLDGRVSPRITDSDPFIDGRPLVSVLPWRIAADKAAAENTARLLRTYLIRAHGKLENHPVNEKRRAAGHMAINGLVTQRAGQLKTIVPFREKYGLRGLIMASGSVYHGLGRYLGMAVEKVTDSHDPGADLAQRLKTALARTDYDFIHVHTKAPDEAAHTKDPVRKQTVIESLDAGLGRALASFINDPDLLTVVTADHSTPSAGPLIHSGETVPLVMAGPGIRRDNVQCFDEVSAAPGALGTVRGRELMYLILNHLDRARLAGIMDTPEDRAYWPGDYEPFTVE